MIRTFVKGGGGGDIEIKASKIEIKAPFDVEAGDVFYASKENYSVEGVAPNAKTVIAVSPDGSVWISPSEIWVKEDNVFVKYSGVNINSNFIYFSPDSKYAVISTNTYHYEGEGEDERTIYTEEINLYHFDRKTRTVKIIFTNSYEQDYTQFNIKTNSYVKWFPENSKCIVAGSIRIIEITLNESANPVTATSRYISPLLSITSGSVVDFMSWDCRTIISHYPSTGNYRQYDGYWNYDKSLNAYNKLNVIFNSTANEYLIYGGIISNDRKMFARCANNIYNGPPKMYFYTGITNGNDINFDLSYEVSLEIVSGEIGWMLLSPDEKEIFIVCKTNNSTSIFQLKKNEISDRFELVTDKFANLKLGVYYHNTYLNFDSEGIICIYNSNLLYTCISFIKDKNNYIPKLNFSGVHKNCFSDIALSPNRKYAVIVNYSSMNYDYLEVYKWNELSNAYSIKLQVHNQEFTQFTGIAFAYTDNNTSVAICANSYQNYKPFYTVVINENNDSVAIEALTAETGIGFTVAKMIHILKNNLIVTTTADAKIVHYKFNPVTRKVISSNQISIDTTSPTRWIFSEDEKDLFVGGNNSNVINWLELNDGSVYSSKQKIYTLPILRGGFVLSKDKNTLLTTSGSNSLRKYEKNDSGLFVFARDVGSNAFTSAPFNLVAIDDIDKLIVQHSITPSHPYSYKDFSYANINEQGNYFSSYISEYYAGEEQNGSQVFGFGLYYLEDLDMIISFSANTYHTNKTIYLYTAGINYTKDASKNNAHYIYIALEPKILGQQVEVYQIPAIK